MVKDAYEHSLDESFRSQLNEYSRQDFVALQKTEDLHERSLVVVAANNSNGYLLDALSAQSLKPTPLQRLFAEAVPNHFEKLVCPDHKWLIHKTQLLLVAESVELVLLVAALKVN